MMAQLRPDAITILEYTVYMFRIMRAYAYIRFETVAIIIIMDIPYIGWATLRWSCQTHKTKNFNETKTEQKKRNNKSKQRMYINVCEK